MKKFNSFIALILSLIPAFGCFSFSAFAQEAAESSPALNTKTVKMINYNVAECTFTVTKTDDFVENTDELTVVKQSPFYIPINTIKWALKDIFHSFANFDRLIDLIKSLF